jgi:hypothetical protein
MIIILLITNLEVKIISFALFVFNSEPKWGTLLKIYSELKYSIIFSITVWENNVLLVNECLFVHKQLQRLQIA